VRAPEDLRPLRFRSDGLICRTGATLGADGGAAFQGTLDGGMAVTFQQHIDTVRVCELS
jgi:hypothetical protein